MVHGSKGSKSHDSDSFKQKEKLGVKGVSLPYRLHFPRFSNFFFAGLTVDFYRDRCDQNLKKKFWQSFACESIGFRYFLR